MLHETGKNHFIAICNFAYVFHFSLSRIIVQITFQLTKSSQIYKYIINYKIIRL